MREECNLNCFNKMSEVFKNPVESNLEKMLGAGNEMSKLLMSESIGGNAGYYKGKACFAANFHYDGDSERPKYFLIIFCSLEYSN